MNSKKKILNIIIVLLIIAISNQIIYRVYYKPKLVLNTDNLLTKVDKNKDYIYDGEYNVSFSSDTYTTEIGNTYYSKNLKVPVFNIKSDYATEANKYLKQIYMEAVEKFNQGIIDKSTYVNFNYEKYENKNMIGVMVKYEVGDVGPTNPFYCAYIFDKKTSNIIKYEKAYELAGFTKSDIDKKVKEAIKKEINNQMGDNPDVYPQGETIDNYVEKSYNSYIETKKYNTIEYILDSNNKLSVVVEINMPAQVDHINTLLEIK